MKEQRWTSGLPGSGPAQARRRGARQEAGLPHTPPNTASQAAPGAVLPILPPGLGLRSSPSCRTKSQSKDSGSRGLLPVSPSRKFQGPSCAAGSQHSARHRSYESTTVLSRWLARWQAGDQKHSEEPEFVKELWGGISTAGPLTRSERFPTPSSCATQLQVRIPSSLSAQRATPTPTPDPVFCCERGLIFFSHEQPGTWR